MLLQRSLRPLTRCLIHLSRHSTPAQLASRSRSGLSSVSPQHAAQHRGVLSMSSAAHNAQTASAVIQQQLELYNAHDLEGFLALMAADVVAVDGLTGAVLSTGIEQLRPRYEARFQTPVSCELLARLVLGSVVVDREIITGLPDGGVADCLATYVVEDNKIKRMTFVWQPRTPGMKL